MCLWLSNSGGRSKKAAAGEKAETATVAATAPAKEATAAPVEGEADVQKGTEE